MSQTPAPSVRFASAALFPGFVHAFIPVTQNLPLASTQSGNVFHDRNDAQLAWYLPAFVLVDDIDTVFAFAATQSGVDAQGSPFFHATLTIGMRKVQPDDAKAYAASNPHVEVREIPLNGLTATLTTTSSDPQTGAPRPSTYIGTIAPAANGSYTATFATLLGAGVIVAYENLQNGGASVTLSASYNVWREQGAPGVWVHPAIVNARPVTFERPMAFAAMRPEPILERPAPPPPPPAQTAPQPTYVQAAATFALTIALAKKYAAVGYATVFTVSDGKTTHPILSVNDLKNFQTQQSEYSEYTELGDVPTKYPSFSRLYIGALSRQIVAVPAQYGILRGSSGTAAVCEALLDSSATETESCKFQFAFVLGPVVSPIDLAALTRDVGASTQAHDCTVVLPTQLDSTKTGVLATPFQTSVAYLAGVRPTTFSLTVEVTDAGASSPAVANANLFIKQLIASIQPFLTGRFYIKLDDFYAQPVDVGVTLNFSVTAGSDDIAFSVDSATQAIDLIDNSPLDLSLNRYATVISGEVNIVPFAQTLLAHQSTSLPGTAAAAEPTVMVDRTIQLESPLTKEATARYLAFSVQDVQAVQYELGVVAAGVSFAARNIASIKVQIVLDDLPQISVPSFTLTPLDQSGNEQIALPIQYALTTLNATMTFTVQPVGAQSAAAPAQFTLKNDFIDQPVFVLADASIPGFPS